MEQLPREEEVVNTNVPAEFRRVELFIAGTGPGRLIKNVDEPLPNEVNIQEVPPSEEPQLTPTPTPIDGTWQDKVYPDANVRRRPDVDSRRTPQPRPSVRRLPGNVEYVPDQP